MNLLKIIKNNLFIQNLAGSIVSFIPAYLEFSVAKYQAIKKALFITAHDETLGSYFQKEFDDIYKETESPETYFENIIYDWYYDNFNQYNYKLKNYDYTRNS